jgi:hypothetical protein
MKNTANVALAVLMMIMIVSCSLPIAMAYPAAFHGIVGSVTGKVLSADNVPVDNANVTIVNASNPDQVYASTTTNSNGEYSFSDVSATYDGPDSIDGHGGMVYSIYVLKTPYGNAYVEPFGLDAQAIAPKIVNPIIKPGASRITVSNSKLSTYMQDDKCAKITATVYDSSGKLAPDGTVVDFSVDEPAWTSKNGSLNKDGDQHVTATTSGGKASVYYGWFPDDTIPAHNTVVASIHYFTSIKASTDLYFPAMAQGTPTPTAAATPTVLPNVTATSTPVPSNDPTPTPAPTVNPTITPTITNTVEPVEQPVTATSVLSWVVYVIVVAIGVAQIIALLLGLRVLKKKK